MIRFIFPALFAVACLGTDDQGIRTHVLDQEGIFSSSEHARFDSLFGAHEELTGNEIAMVTSEDFEGYEKVVDFATEFGNRHGVGKKDLDNGVVIAFSKARREVLIATGYGAERVLHDSICLRIVESIMVPHFKEDRHFDGLWAGGLAIVEFLERPENKIQPR